MKIFFVFCLLFFAKTLWAQSITVLAKETQEPIAFASIVIKEDGKIIFSSYCNNDGLGYIKPIEYDTVEISCVGYKPKTLNVKTIKDTVFLEKETYKLDEVVINSKRIIDTLLLGEFNQKKKGVLQLYPQNEVALFFENNFTQKLALTTFLFRIKRVKYKTAIRIRLYKSHNFETYCFSLSDPEKKKHYYKSFIPGNDFMGENIIVYLNPQKKSIVEVDLSEYNIEMPKEGVFVSVECLGYFDENDKPITVNKNKLSEIEMHLTDADNYCIEYTNTTRFWVNQNLHLKMDFKYALKEEVPKNILKAPIFGLKVVAFE